MEFMQILGVLLGSAAFVFGVMLRVDRDARKRDRAK